MASTILIRNLPDDIAEETLRQAIGEYLPVTKLEILDDPNPKTSDKQAVIHADIPTFEAETFARRFNGRIIQGREVTVVAMLFMG